MDFKSLLDLIEESRAIAIKTHENADADAIGSSLALKMVIGQLGREAVVIAPDSISKLGRVLANEVGEDVLTEGPPSPLDLIIYVDSRPTTESLSDGRLAVIDHHQGELEVETSYSFIDPTFGSTAEMVYEFVSYLVSRKKITLSGDIGRLLLWGIIADTGGLRLALKPTLERIIGITEVTGVELRDAYALMRTPPDPSLRMACLKGASRLKIMRRGDVLVATTEVSSFQGDVANALVHLGSDVAFAGGGKTKVINVSARARTQVVDAGLNLAEVMGTVAGRVDGKGGGHAGAAALRGHGNVQEILDMCVAETKRALKIHRDGAIPKT